MSKITLIVPITFTEESGAIKSHFATKAGLQKPAMYGYLVRNDNGWSIHMDSDEETSFKDQGLTTQLLTSELRGLPDCALLVSPRDADHIEALLQGLRHEVKPSLTKAL